MPNGGLQCHVTQLNPLWLSCKCFSRHLQACCVGNCSLMQVWECSVSLLIYLLCSPPSQADQAVQRLNYLESDFSHWIISRFAAPICPGTVLLKSFCWTQAIAGPSWENRDTNIYVPAAGKSFCHPSKSCPVFSYFHNIAIPKIIDSCLLEV